tara:strand:+ start:7780 stop:8568 length:789 start_codon:yes stop_codon:yes gene_type:complete
MVLFSIIIPTYNQANLLKVALDSLIEQSYKKWEAIVIDNFSNDSTQLVINSYKDKRIRSFKLRNDGIIAASRNHGIKKSKGEYICFLDSDDFWFSNKLEVINKLIPKGYNFISNGEIWINEKNKKRIKNYDNSDKTLYKRLLLLGNNLSTSAITIERKLLLNNNCFYTNANFIGIEDYDLWLRIARDKGKNYFAIKQPLGVFRIHKEGNSRKLKRQLLSEINVLRSHFKNTNRVFILTNIFLNLRILKTFITYFIFGNLKNL